MGVYKVKDKYYIDFYMDGRRIRKPVGSKRDAENALSAVKADILRGEYRFKKDRKIRFEDFAKEYLDYAKINKRSWGRDQTSLNKLIPFLGDTLLSKITVAQIEKYKKMRLDEVKPATINRELACLKHMFTIAEKLGKYDGKNPVKGTKYLHERQYVMKILDREEIKRLIDASTGYMRPMIILALNTGMRRGEVFNLHWNDIDWIENYIYIKETKSNVMRKVPMNSIVRSTLKNLKRENELVFPSPKTKLPFKDIWFALQKVCKKAGIKDLRFHDLRHTAATVMVIGGIDLVTVKEILGHSSIEMTMRYAHPTPENKRKAVNALASMFDAPKGKNIVTNRSQEEIKESTTPLLSDRKN